MKMIAAVYSRKSVFTCKGDSIENQIQLCKDYAENYLKDKDITEFIIYEDEGFSGGNTNRPGFKKLIEDAKTKKFQVLICYRLDRISRNVADFSSTLEILQKNNIDFVSIKEQFDTSTPMGRAMVYISSVFAQLERETIAERVKDNMYELAKSGRWLGGQTPLGFDSEKITYLDSELKERNVVKLIPNEEELIRVKYIFDLYSKEKSIHKVLRECLSLNITGKNGGDFQAMSIRDILRNPVYVKSNHEVLKYFEKQGCCVVGMPNGQGLLTYGKTSNDHEADKNNWIIAVAKHNGLIDSKVWLEIQRLLDYKSKPSNKKIGTSKTALLTGILKCSKCGSSMRVSYGKIRNDGTKNYYYTCTMKANSGKTRCDSQNLLGPLVDDAVIDKLENVKTNYLVEELLKQRDKNSSKDNKLIELNKKIDIYNKKIENLLSKLSYADESVTKYIIDEISNLDKEKNYSLNELNKIKCDKSTSEISNEDIDYVIDCAKNFKNLYNSCETMLEKRLLIESIIEEIKINGETGESHIYYWGSRNT